MASRFVVVPLILEIDKDAWDFFHGKSPKDLAVLTGGRTLFILPVSMDDLFTENGAKRYPGLQRGQLSCLWAEDKDSQHFTVSLRNLNPDQIRDLLSDLGDSADGAPGVPAWKAAFEQRQAARRQTPVANKPSSTPGKGPGDHKESGMNGNDKQPPQNGGGKEDTGGNAPLVALGKIAGIGGIAAGIFFSLFAKLAFPQLVAGQASLFMFLAYGVAVIGLIIWATQVSKGWIVPWALVAVSIVMAFFGWSSLRQGADGTAYNVRVTVLSPDNIPVNDAHVWSDLGGEAKKVDGGWEIDIPLTAATGHKLNVYAEVQDRGWSGNAFVTLAENHAPPLTVSLKRAGELPVRGMVLDLDGKAVPNAQVTIPGYDGVSTGAHGEFTLPSHAHEGDTVHLHAELPPNFVADLLAYKVGSAPAELLLKVRGQAQKTAAHPAAATPGVHPTKDAVIDRVLANLASLKKSGRPPTEAQLAETLAPLFVRPDFYSIQPENWRYFLYPLCRTRLLLEEYESQFKSNPDTRHNIAQAIALMVALQNRVAALYGPNFQIAEHINRYSNDRDAFNDNLPPVMAAPKPDFFVDCNRQLGEIHTLLHAAGITP